MSDSIIKPLVSICIPIFNGENFLNACLTSAYRQDYPNLEVIISDDASNDQSLAIVHNVSKKYSMPTHVFHHTPKGIGANWNNCVKHANGDYIKFLCQDDLLQPNCISKMMALALTDKNVGLVYCKRQLHTESKDSVTGEFLRYYGNLQQHWHNLNITRGILDGKAYLADQYLLNSPKNKIGEPTAVLLKKECFDKVGFFSTSLHQLLDVEFWYRLMPLYKVGFIGEQLATFRVHGEQASANNKDRNHQEQEVLFKAFYNSILKYLHPKNQWKLKKQCHPLLKLMYQLKARVNG